MAHDNPPSPASMEPVAAASPSDVLPTLTEEPATGTEGAVRIQFRLPSGGRCVRHFLKNDPVKLLYSFVYHEAKDGLGRNLEMKYGFPPKDVRAIRDKTIEEASLAGESIQCRWL